MSPKVICEKLDPAAFQLILNESLPRFGELSALLSKNRIPFEATQAAQNFSLQVLQMGFSPKCNFRDVYLLALLFKEFGLQHVYPLNTKKPIVQFGTYLHKFPRRTWADFIVGDPMDVDSFLEIPADTPMKEVIDSFFDDDFRTAYNEDPNRDKVERENSYDGYSEYIKDREDDVVEEETDEDDED